MFRGVWDQGLRVIGCLILKSRLCVFLCAWETVCLCGKGYDLGDILAFGVLARGTGRPGAN